VSSLKKIKIASRIMKMSPKNNFQLVDENKSKELIIDDFTNQNQEEDKIGKIYDYLLIINNFQYKESLRF